MEEKLFKTALEYINDFSLVCYAIRIEPRPYAGNKISLQGEIEDNEKVMSVLKFDYDKENEWYYYVNDKVSITLTK